MHRIVFIAGNVSLKFLQSIVFFILMSLLELITGVTDILALRPRGKAVIRRLKHHSVILPVQKVFISIKFKILKIF